MRSAPAKAFFDGAGAEPWTTSPADLVQFQAAETQKWGRIIRTAGIQAE